METEWRFCPSGTTVFIKGKQLFNLMYFKNYMWLVSAKKYLAVP